MTKKCLLVIIDGLGINLEDKEGDATKKEAKTLNMLAEKYPAYLLKAHGEYVGLTPGLMGNSEVGHLTIGSGRIVQQQLVRINTSIENNTLSEYLVPLNQYKYKRRLHIMGLLSDGGAHSHICHFESILKNLQFDEVFLHAILDGRDTKPDICQKFIDQVEGTFSNLKKGCLASIAGRFYAMDRDNNIERTKKYFEILTEGPSIFSKANEAVNHCYGQGIYDEHIPPILLNERGIIIPDDVVFYFNFRADRMRQIANMFKKRNISFSLTRYLEDTQIEVVFEKDSINDGLAHLLSENNLKQAHIAETEKYAHVTYFFNGGTEEKIYKEDRILVPSPKIGSYDLCPDVGMWRVCEKVIECFDNQYDFIVCNLAGPDMVGHTGNFNATCESVRTTDEIILLLHNHCSEFGYTLFITADHGNAENMLDEKGNPCKKHTSNPVPFIICLGEKNRKIKWLSGENYSLADVAPTICYFFGIPISKNMTGKNLFVE